MMCLRNITFAPSDPAMAYRPSISLKSWAAAPRAIFCAARRYVGKMSVADHFRCSSRHPGTISMRVLVFTAHTNWKPHYETDLEIIQRHLDDGDEVIHLHCDADLPACDANPNHDLAKCRNCIEIRKAGISLLSARVPSISFLNLSESNKRELSAVQKTFATIAELKSFYIEEFDTGMAVFSSIISLTREAETDLSVGGDTVFRIF